jgi:hypothetical protein
MSQLPPLISEGLGVVFMGEESLVGSSVLPGEGRAVVQTKTSKRKNTVTKNE